MLLFELEYKLFSGIILCNLSYINNYSKFYGKFQCVMPKVLHKNLTVVTKIIY